MPCSLHTSAQFLLEFEVEEGEDVEGRRESLVEYYKHLHTIDLILAHALIFDGQQFVAPPVRPPHPRPPHDPHERAQQASPLKLRTPPSQNGSATTK